MNFFKYEALGNDFVITDNTISEKDAVKLCNRNFGIGADGVLVYLKSEEFDAEMKIINSDGSVPEMCGNGLRCFVSYLVTEHRFHISPLKILTGRGVLEVHWEKKDGKIEVSANLGKAEILGKEVAKMDGLNLDLFGISMGNPHVVIISEEKIDPEQIEKMAVHFQKENFLNREVNVEVVTGINVMQRKISLVVNERGAGFTLGCGTGGGAVTKAVQNIKGISGGTWDVVFPGGTAKYEILLNGDVVMTGIPNKVFQGVLNDRRI